MILTLLPEPGAVPADRIGITSLAAPVLLAALALLTSAILTTTAGASPPTANGRNPEATASIVGGHAATITEYPSLAYIEGVEATSGYACTGTVVAPRVVLTAGHCVEDIESDSITQPRLIAVATGVFDLHRVPRAQISRVERVLAYPGFDPGELHGDAGLLILSAPVGAEPIALAGAADAPLYEPGDELTIAGWGIDDQATEHAPDLLQAATVPIEEGVRCREGTRRYYPFLDPARQLCTLDPASRVTTCHGDSGGPAIATRPDGTMVEVGITSLGDGDGDCDPAAPAVFTRVDQISSWVEGWIDAVESGGPTPRVRVPRAHLPPLTHERAEELGAIVMEEAFEARFSHGKERTIRCERLARARLRCGVSWHEGQSDYFGSVTVFYAIRHNVVLAAAHYAVHWVDDRCWLHSGHRGSCPVQTKRR